MTRPEKPQSSPAADAAVLTRELTRGLASGVSKRSPDQIRADFRKAREAA